MNDEFKAEMQLNKAPAESDSDYISSEDEERRDYTQGKY